ncbi:hypothetical protein OG279_26150 [Streptomyces sp. NBC_01201]|uniref:hypothetical protein n=1 Tax=Streptomyces sp. NBC_01201 TaxID=2903770 RepID=UPI002E0F4520|nr:hypothetical protein OG279_26150 [Streptomyces sp. NBC_01201]
MTTETPAAVLRAAAALLREAASHATPGPWRTHDTHLGGTGGHTATVLTDRENLTDTELIAWLPTMSNTPWDEARNAWRNAGWMALMDPSVGLALADWLESTALTVDAVAEKLQPDPAAHWIAPALAVARRVLGATEQADTETAPAADRDAELADLRAELDKLIRWHKEDGDQMAKMRKTIERLRAERIELIRQRDQIAMDTIKAMPAPADRAAIEALATEREKRGRYGDSSVTDRARELRAVLAAEAQQPTPAPAEETK